MLGTYVEIAAFGAGAVAAREAIEAAFSAIEEIERLMSPFREESDVSRLNRGARRRPVRVSKKTYALLQRCLYLFEETRGLFDITATCDTSSGDSADIELKAGCRVSFRNPIQINVCGIAKGLAVDKAIDALKSREIPAGLVNAGGDLRVFGELAIPVALRDPSRPNHVVSIGRLKNGALATSAFYFNRDPHIHPKRRERVSSKDSFSVIAADCCLADALTKPLLAEPERALDLFPQLGAAALRLTQRGALLGSEGLARWLA